MNNPSFDEQDQARAQAAKLIADHVGGIIPDDHEWIAIAWPKHKTNVDRKEVIIVGESDKPRAAIVVGAVAKGLQSNEGQFTEV